MYRADVINQTAWEIDDPGRALEGNTGSEVALGSS